MRITVAPIPIAVGRFELQIRGPGIVRHIAFEMREKLIMSKGQPDFEERPVMFVEASPTGPLVNRKFLVITHGEYAETDDAVNETATWVGTGVSGRGTVVHVFELKGAA